MGYKTTSDGSRVVATQKSDQEKLTIISHDWTDPTTWYSNSVRVVDEVPTNSGDDQEYHLANKWVIDTYHGKLSKEDFLKDSDGYSYRATVKVNDVVKTEQDPHYGSGGDYTINYLDGYVNFTSALDPADVVKVTYHRATDSRFLVKPQAGKILKIHYVETQFSKDVIVTDSTHFQPKGYVDVFAPQYTPVPYPSGTLIPLGDPVIYKSMRDYQNDANRSYPTYPAIGGNGWRGMADDIVVFVWDYTSSTQISSKAGMQIDIFLEHDLPFEGSYATVTFYCLVEPEA